VFFFSWNFTAKASVSSVKDSTDGISLQNFTAAGSNSSNIVIGMGDKPDYILSCLTSMMSSMVITTTIEEGLINEKIDGSLYPGLALNVPSFQDGTWTTYDVNGKTYMKTTYYLREDAKWSDGVPINYKDDINFAVYDIYLSGKIKQIPSTEPYNKIEKIEFPNPYTMVVTWNSAISSANRGLPIYPKHFYSQVPLDQLTSSTLVKKPVHAGPYRVKEWVEGSYITVEPNPYYYGEMPKMQDLLLNSHLIQLRTFNLGMLIWRLILVIMTPSKQKKFLGLPF